MSPQTDSTAGGSAAAPAVVYFAKVPRPGQVKTRLVPPLTPGEAAALYGAFLRAAVVPIPGARTLVYGWPGDDLDGLRPFVGDELELRPQRGEDLFERVQHCFDELFAAGHSPVVVRNTDSPDLPPDRVAEALACADGEVTLGPDGGGGYYLVALAAPCPGLFDALGEGGDTVLGQTRRRAERLGLAVRMLRVERDVDTFDDLLALWRGRV